MPRKNEVDELAFIYTFRKDKHGRPTIGRIYKDDFVHLRSRGMSAAEIVEGVQTPSTNKAMIAIGNCVIARTLVFKRVPVGAGVIAYWKVR